MLKRFSAILVMFVLAFSIVGSAFASDGGPTDVTSPEGSGLPGIAPTIGSQVSDASGGNLVYHGGPVMPTTKTYAIYWIPSGYGFAPGYTTRINQFFTDVAAASGATSNVFYTATQYYGAGLNHIRYNSQFKGFYIDTYAFPASGCPLYAGVTKCLTDAQLRVEINRVIALKHWAPNAITEFFIFTPNHVGSCINGSGSNGCAFTATGFCSYHWSTGPVIYANQPYTLTNAARCGLQKFTATSPNGFAADSTINQISAQYNGSITDTRTSSNPGWITNDPAPAEIEDKCAWKFGSLAAGYNQIINGRKYILQGEWSNKSSACVWKGY